MKIKGILWSASQSLPSDLHDILGEIAGRIMTMMNRLKYDSEEEAQYAVDELVESACIEHGLSDEDTACILRHACFVPWFEKNY